MSQQARRLAALLLLYAAAAFAACGGSIDVDGPAGNNMGDAGAGATTTTDPDAPGGVVVICNGVECAPAHECCLTTGECFDPIASPNACPQPTEPGPQGQTPCGASSQCAPGEYCAPANPQLCLGPGYCESMTNCPESGPEPSCGCNGVTYPNHQSACAAGVPLAASQGACGETTTIGGGGGLPGKQVTPCATDAMCPEGQSCCGITGECYDPAVPVLCSFPPEGTTFPCVDDTQCIAGAEYCYAEGCEGPGGCVLRPGSAVCDGHLDPVCGCNGVSYVNPECAAVDGTRIAHAGECM